MSELSPETRALLLRGRTYDGLPQEARARMKGALVARTAGAFALTATFARSGAALAWKVVAVTAVTVALGGAGVVAWRAPQRTHPAQGTSPPAAATGETAADRGREGEPEAQHGTASEAPPSVVDRRADAPRVRPGREAPTAESRSRAPAPPTDAEQAVPSKTPEPATLAGAPAAPVPRPSPLEQEARLLRDAHRALVAGDPSRALALLNEDARRFPRGALEPERAAERVFALCATGDVEQATREAQSFVRLHAPGTLANRVAQGCSGPR